MQAGVDVGLSLGAVIALQGVTQLVGERQDLREKEREGGAGPGCS
jgi:hypothetical protein